jgi:hypothetical protein
MQGRTNAVVELVVFLSQEKWQLIRVQHEDCVEYVILRGPPILEFVSLPLDQLHTIDICFLQGGKEIFF